MPFFDKLVFSLSVILRIYSWDDTFAKIYTPSPGFAFVHLTEIQAALPFARDYDEHGVHTNGVFKPYWDERSVTPQLISQFKQNYSSKGVKATVFASIGGRSPKHPFHIKDGDVDAWVSNAVESLTTIVKKYNLDGIDVYYEHINATRDEFVNAIGMLIFTLKEKEAITVVSIAPSAAVNNNFYVPLFEQHGKSIGTVAYQSHNEVEPVPDPETFARRFKTEATRIYGKDKVLAGYSAIYKDWGTLSPIVYFLGVIDILGFNPLSADFYIGGYSAVGTSIWFVPPDELTCAPDTAISSASWAKRMLEASACQIMAN